MTATVRLFSVSGLSTAPVVSGTRLAYDSVQLLKWPILGRDVLTCTGATTDTSEDSAAPDRSALAYIQVESGKSVHYEVIPANYETVEADTTSPILSGNTTIEWGPGWRISVLEAE